MNEVHLSSNLITHVEIRLGFSIRPIAEYTIMRNSVVQYFDLITFVDLIRILGLFFFAFLVEPDTKENVLKHS